MSQQRSLIDAIPEESKQLHPDSVKASRISHTIASLIMLIAGSVVSFLIDSWIAWSIAVGVVLFIFVLGFIWAKKLTSILGIG